MTDQEFVNLVCTLFGRAFDVEIGPHDRKRVETEVLHGWTNADRSEVEFFKIFLGDLDKLPEQVTQANDASLAVLKQAMKLAFRNAAQDDLGRVLRALFVAIERARPGATEVPLDHLDRYRRSLNAAVANRNAAAGAAIDFINRRQIQADMHAAIQRSIELTNPPRRRLW